jgi:hypothetical protein
MKHLSTRKVTDLSTDLNPFQCGAVSRHLHITALARAKLAMKKYIILMQCCESMGCLARLPVSEIFHPVIPDPKLSFFKSRILYMQ